MGQTGFLGEVRMFAGNFAPRGWALCEGQLLAISPNTALFSLLGTIYGGDGRTTFALPDLRGRAPISAGHGPGLSSYREGTKGGVETVTLNTNQIPSHNHAVAMTVSVGTNAEASNSAEGAGNVLGEAGANIYNGNPTEDALGGVSASVQVGMTGGNQAHSNMAPFLAINYIICTQGTYPSRS